MISFFPSREELSTLFGRTKEFRAYGHRFD